MSLSGSERTRIATGGPGVSYAGFAAKVAFLSRPDNGNFTRLAVGGPGMSYAGFTAKSPAEGPAINYMRIGRRIQLAR